MKPTATHFHLVPSLKMCGASPPQCLKLSSVIGKYRRQWTV